LDALTFIGFGSTWSMSSNVGLTKKLKALEITKDLKINVTDARLTDIRWKYRNYIAANLPAFGGILPLF